ncbi:alpha/beta fold hydrolase [Caulobacter sp. KR2-114]|uniref:alpha/beta fold hydrolase n=1 Tax=Caulobacter sp. KR2-114 TaxID=3400912 RepID=UPI003C01E76F
MPPTLFFLPGAGADPDFWRPLADRLPPTWDKVRFGWPGLGAQPADPAVRSFDDLVRRVEARLVDRPVDLIAQSMGGAVAMAVTLRNPGRVRRLVLTVTSGGVDVEGLGGSNWRETYRRNNPGAAWITEARPDFTDRLRGVTQPVLLLWGDADPISPVAVGEHLRGLLPNAALRVLPGGDHDLAQTRAAEIAPWVLAHLS